MPAPISAPNPPFAIVVMKDCPPLSFPTLQISALLREEHRQTSGFVAHCHRRLLQDVPELSTPMRRGGHV